jgi:hypothetical protein
MMYAILRFLLLTAIVVVGARCLHRLSRADVSVLAVDWVEVADVVYGLDGERERWRNQDRGLQAVLERMRLKSEAIDNLIAGRTTLLRVAALFRHLQETSGERDAFAPAPHSTRAEGYCQEVLAWVAADLEDDPTPQKAALLQQLTWEFKHHVNQPGGLHLPDW